MSEGPLTHMPPLRLVDEAPAAPETECPGRDERQQTGSAREFDWSILMARAQAGDRAAYRRLLGDITPYLRALAGRQLHAGDTEDAVQDILLTLHTIRHTYDPTRPFGPWLVAIAKRRLIDRLRRQQRLQFRESTLTSAHETFCGDDANIPDEWPDRRQLWDAVDMLPRGQRQAVRLLKLEEMSLKEASAASGMSVAALKAATHRALKNLRRMLAGKDGDA